MLAGKKASVIEQILPTSIIKVYLNDEENVQVARVS